MQIDIQIYIICNVLYVNCIYCSTIYSPYSI
jgi:hypothetical protein